MASTELGIFSGIPISPLMNSSEFSRDVSGIPMSPLMNSSEFSRNELIHYFAMCGLSTNSIEKILTGKFGYSITKRHIRRIRAKLGVSQKSEESSIMKIGDTIQV